MNTKNIQEKQQLRKRLNPLSGMKQLLSVRQIRQSCSSSACTQQTKCFLQVQISQCIFTEKFVAVLQVGTQWGACCFLLSTCAVHLLLTANSKCKKNNGVEHGCEGPEKNQGVEKADCCHQNSYSYWLTKGPQGTWCRLNNSPHQM